MVSLVSVFVTRCLPLGAGTWKDASVGVSRSLRLTDTRFVFLLLSHTHTLSLVWLPLTLVFALCAHSQSLVVAVCCSLIILSLSTLPSSLLSLVVSFSHHGLHLLSVLHPLKRPTLSQSLASLPFTRSPPPPHSLRFSHSRCLSHTRCLSLSPSVSHAMSLARCPSPILYTLPLTRPLTHCLILSFIRRTVFTLILVASRPFSCPISLSLSLSTSPPSRSLSLTHSLTDSTLTRCPSALPHLPSVIFLVAAVSTLSLSLSLSRCLSPSLVRCLCLLLVFSVHYLTRSLTQCIILSHTRSCYLSLVLPPSAHYLSLVLSFLSHSLSALCLFLTLDVSFSHSLSVSDSLTCPRLSLTESQSLALPVTRHCLSIRHSLPLLSRSFSNSLPSL